MQVQIDIGENQHFQLRDALLVYRDHRAAYITRHDVRMHEDKPPTLEPAQPLTMTFVETLMRSLSGNVLTEILPENVLAKGDRMIVWWTRAQRRQMFFQNSMGKADELNGHVFPVPTLVWRVANGGLWIRALTEDKRPQEDTKLFVAPLWNLSEDGRVCLGSTRCPDNASAASIPDWERGFYESAFTHANVGRLTRHEGGFEGLWQGLADAENPFPIDNLIALPQTLGQFARGKRS